MLAAETAPFLTSPRSLSHQSPAWEQRPANKPTQTVIPPFDLKIGDTTLDLVELSDAEFIVELRTDETLGRFISKTDSDVTAQVTWLENYKSRESRNEEFYFIVKYQSAPAGTIRLYDFKDDSFTMGSWVIKKGTPQGAAIAATMMGYRAGFQTLGCNLCCFDVRKGNRSSFPFHKRWGAVPYKEDDLNVYFTLSRSDFHKNFGTFLRFT